MFSRAVPYFQEAIRLAPKWGYPRHYLALAQMETGDYVSAEKSYRAAMDIAPEHAYLPFGLGYLYQRLNRKRDAALCYRQALMLAPSNASIYDLMGTLYESEGHRTEAMQLYRHALTLDPTSLTARHNLAGLLSHDPKRIDEAVALWRQNVQERFMPSMVDLAALERRRGHAEESLDLYRAIVSAQPDLLSARLAEVELLVETGRKEEALATMRNVAQSRPDDAKVMERLGDLERAIGHSRESAAAYEQALQNARKEDTSRLRSKLRQLPGQGQ